MPNDEHTDSTGTANDGVFVYTGADGGPTPRRATRVRVHASVRTLPARAFDGCTGLREAELPDGLEAIGDGAFRGCVALGRIAVPSTVRRIGTAAFLGCAGLVEAVLREGTEEIGMAAFKGCSSLGRATVPSSVRRIGAGAFQDCRALAGVELRDGIEAIGRDAFRACKSLRKVAVPGSVKVIEAWTFCQCESLTEVELRSGLEKIDRDAFHLCKSLVRIAIPPTVEKIGDRAFKWCHALMSVELNEGLQMIGDMAFIDCRSLRNVAIPPTCRLGTTPFTFPTISQALKHRFDVRPIHKICYFQQSHQPDAVLRRFEDAIGSSGESNDCIPLDFLGMTPLHIMMCSSRHGLRLYRAMIKAQPASLIANDGLGIPILYGFWSRAPKEVIQLVSESHIANFPDDILDWERMLVVLGEANAPESIQMLVDANSQYFSGQRINWEECAVELAGSERVSAATMQFVLRLAVAGRLEALDVEKWRRAANDYIDRFPRAVTRSVRILDEKEEKFSRMLFSVLASWERSKEAASSLELAAWRAALDDAAPEGRCALREEERSQRRFGCGAQEIVPNVLPFLLPRGLHTP